MDDVYIWKNSHKRLIVMEKIIFKYDQEITIKNTNLISSVFEISDR